MADVVEKKKRGRKPKDTKGVAANAKTIIDGLNITLTKSDKDQDADNVDQSISDVASATKEKLDCSIEHVDVVEHVENAAPKKGKRGRKPKVVYASYEIPSVADDTNISSLSDDENVIVRLNIMDTIGDDDVSSSSTEHPYAYNHDTYCNIPNINDIVRETQEQTSLMDKHDVSTSLKIVSVLQDFEEKNKNKEWPLNTSISCYWCCHRFENAPIGIPVNVAHDAFEVYGCFCSLECAAAYNFDNNTNQDEMWERYNLLNLLSRRMRLENVVKAAPPRLSLKIFGGHLDIDAFRAFHKTQKLVNINFPPMTSITQQLEEINDFEMGNDFKYIPVDNDRINKYKEKIVFRRNKPLVDTKKSLETAMNLKYS
jgi:hypothetical protein